MNSESSIAWAPESGGWIAVMPVLGRTPDGDVLIGARPEDVAAVAEDRPGASWQGELVLRDGRRLAVGPGGELHVESRGDRLNLAGTASAGIEARQLQAARLELQFPGPAR